MTYQEMPPFSPRSPLTSLHPKAPYSPVPYNRLLPLLAKDPPAIAGISRYPTSNGHFVGNIPVVETEKKVGTRYRCRSSIMTGIDVSLCIMTAGYRCACLGLQTICGDCPDCVGFPASISLIVDESVGLSVSVNRWPSRHENKLTHFHTHSLTHPLTHYRVEFLLRPLITLRHFCLIVKDLRGPWTDNKAIHFR